MRPVFIGIAGGTGSGKTTVTRAIVSRVPEATVAVIEQDSYYKDQSCLPFEERLKINYDHPAAFDTPLLVAHLDQLAAGQPIEKPVYNYKTHTRETYTVRVEPKDIIVVEGLLILWEPDIRRRLDIKIYVDCDADVRVLRRLERDIRERGRTMESVIRQYLESVRPMHLEFVEPSKRYADIIIPEGGFNEVAVDMVATKLAATLRDRLGR
ncbi:MAG: uridine kinase [Bacillota bacterium]|nr:MAG: uridine kinase [Bacillota bacterium]